MPLLYVPQGKWFCENADLGDLAGGDKIRNYAENKVFDLIVHDPMSSGNKVAEIAKDDREYYAATENYNTPLSIIYNNCPYLQLTYNTTSSIPSEDPSEIVCYIKINSYDNSYGLFYSEGVNTHIIRIACIPYPTGGKLSLVYDNYILNYPLQLEQWFKFNLKFNNQRSNRDEVPCSILINDYCLGNYTWTNIQKYPTRIYACGIPGSTLWLSDLTVYQHIEKSKPLKPLIKILREDIDDTTVKLTAKVKNPTLPDEQIPRYYKFVLSKEFSGRYDGIQAGRFNGLTYKTRTTNVYVSNPVTEDIVFVDSNGNDIACTCSYLNGRWSDNGIRAYAPGSFFCTNKNQLWSGGIQNYTTTDWNAVYSGYTSPLMYQVLFTNTLKLIDISSLVFEDVYDPASRSDVKVDLYASDDLTNWELIKTQTVSCTGITYTFTVDQQ